MIHYHGTPITPRTQLLQMSGKNFCISFAAPRDLSTCLQIGQSVMLDNGAFSAFTRGKPVDFNAYYEWIAPVLAPPHWAVVPDVIGGSLDEQKKMLATWPKESFGIMNCAPVFHMHLPLNHLHWLVDNYPKICIGSSAEFWQVGSPKWCGRMDEIFNFLIKTFNRMPWVHGLRMLGQTDGGWPFASADSTNVAQNHNRKGCANCMATRIDAVQPSQRWTARPVQQELVA